MTFFVFIQKNNYFFLSFSENLIKSKLNFCPQQKYTISRKQIRLFWGVENIFELFFRSILKYKFEIEMKFRNIFWSILKKKFQDWLQRPDTGVIRKVKFKSNQVWFIFCFLIKYSFQKWPKYNHFATFTEIQSKSLSYFV